MERITSQRRLNHRGLFVVLVIVAFFLPCFAFAPIQASIQDRGQGVSVKINNRETQLNEILAQVWKMFSLSNNEDKIGDGIKKAKDYKSLIIDLRDCNESLFGAGDSFESVRNLQEFIGYLFDRDTKIADVKKRKEVKPLLAKTREDKAFKGKL